MSVWIGKTKTWVSNGAVVHLQKLERELEEKGSALLERHVEQLRQAWGNNKKQAA